MNVKYQKSAVYILSIMARTGYYDHMTGFADSIGVTRCTLSNWLTGRTRPNARSLVLLKKRYPGLVDIGYMFKIYQEEDKKNA